MNKNSLKYCFLLLIVSSKFGYGQNLNRCVWPKIDSIRGQKNNKIAYIKREFEKAVYEKMQEKKSNFRVFNEIIRIPVVVHIIHNNPNGIIGGTNNTNISDEQVYSQIKVLNEDYRRKEGTRGYNTNEVGADTAIEFFLATKDPSGNPSNGIVRVYNAQQDYDIIEDRELLSSLSYWDSNKYLNIWVTNFKDDYLGFGEFPGGSGVEGIETEDAYERIDGVFIDYKAFGREIGTAISGPYNLGRTATHEIGHWFGLIHTWGDEFCGTDYVEDTPQIQSANRFSTCRTIFSNCHGTQVRNMIENYMDYSPDACMNIFTVGQSERIRAVLEVSKRRRRIVNFSKFGLPASEKLSLDVLPNPTQPNALSVQVFLPDFQDFTISLYDIFGRKVHEESYKDLPSTIVKLKTDNLQAGRYYMTVSSKNEVVSKLVILY